jgi:hypothetical protein
MSLKNPVTPPGIDPGSVRLVQQRLNHYATPGPGNPLAHRNYLKSRTEYYGEKISMDRLVNKAKTQGNETGNYDTNYMLKAALQVTL